MPDKTSQDITKARRTKLCEAEHASKIDAKRILSSPRIEVDYDKFAHFLAGCDATEPQKREYVQLVWGIVFEFASLGFEMHPI